MPSYLVFDDIDGGGSHTDGSAGGGTSDGTGDGIENMYRLWWLTQSFGTKVAGVQCIARRLQEPGKAMKSPSVQLKPAVSAVERLLPQINLQWFQHLPRNHRMQCASSVEILTQKRN